MRYEGVALVPIECLSQRSVIMAIVSSVVVDGSSSVFLFGFNERSVSMVER